MAVLSSESYHTDQWDFDGETYEGSHVGVPGTVHNIKPVVVVTFTIENPGQGEKPFKRITKLEAPTTTPNPATTPATSPALALPASARGRFNMAGLFARSVIHDFIDKAYDAGRRAAVIGCIGTLVICGGGTTVCALAFRYAVEHWPK